MTPRELDYTHGTLSKSRHEPSGLPSTPLADLRVITWALLALLSTAPAQLIAQAALRPGTEIVVAPVFQSWRFGSGVVLDSLRVHGATQISAPFTVSVPVFSRWNASVSGAIARSQLDSDGPSGAQSRTLTGLTDLRVRASGHILADGLQLTLGINLPTGKKALSSAQYEVLRVVAAPALDAQVPVLGLGLGGTVGLVYAHEIRAWAWAGGVGIEQRGRFTPVEARLAGLSARSELAPGIATHLSLGTDGLVGAHRLTVGVVADLYGPDEVRLVVPGVQASTQKYQLGPTVSGVAQLSISNPRIRDLTVRLNNRYRSAFSDNSGAAVAGSSGNYLELSAAGLLGEAGHRSLLLGVDVQQHTGLAVDPAFIGAGLTSIGATVGVSLPSGAFEWRPSLRAFAGSLKTGGGNTGITGVTIGVTFNAR